MNRYRQLKNNEPRIPWKRSPSWKQNPAGIMLVLSVLVLTSGVIPGSCLAQQKTDVQCIWKQAKHSAFTDLVRFQDRFVCTFRESAAHVPRNHQQDGKIRLIRSTDGKDWKDWHLIELDQVDLRDPKISVTPDGRLMALMGGSYYESGRLLKRKPFVVFYDPAKDLWTDPQPVQLPKEVRSEFDWLWRVTWHQGTGYGIVYQNNRKPWGLYLAKTADGIQFELVKKFGLPGRPNESTIRFDQQGNMVVVVRNEDSSVKGHLGKSQPPFKEWKWRKTEQRLGGPNFVFLPDGSIVLGTRRYGKKTTTILANLEGDGSIRRFMELPSGGDTSYPGMILHKGDLCVSYYSSHEGNSRIYFYRQNLKSIETMSKLARKPANQKFARHQFKNDQGKSLNYRLLSPKPVEENRKYPLVIFFHGAGERGSDNRAQLIHGMHDFASSEIMETYPAFVFAPQCPKNKMWADTDWSLDSHTMTKDPSGTMKLVIEAVDQLIAEKPIDPDRIYVTGLSMGGFGTWDLISRFPNKFAAAAPICGGGDSNPAVVKKIKHIPIWVIHGDSDRAVKPSRSIEMVEELKKQGGKPKFTLMKNTGHNSWSKTYRDPEFYRWMFEQKRK